MREFHKKYRLFSRNGPPVDIPCPIIYKYILYMIKNKLIRFIFVFKTSFLLLALALHSIPWTASAAGEALTPERQAELNEKLKVALSDVESDQIKSLILQGANPDTRDPESSWTIFHVAIGLGDLELATFAVQNKANINALATKRYYSPLSFAAVSSNLDILKLLVESGADLNQVNADNATALSFLAGRKNRQWVKVLLSHGANPFVGDLDEEGLTLVLDVINELKREKTAQKQSLQMCNQKRAEAAAKEEVLPLLPREAIDHIMEFVAR